MSDAAKVAQYWGRELNISNERAKQVLGMTFRDPEESMEEMVTSMIEIGLLEDKRPPKK